MALDLRALGAPDWARIQALAEDRVGTDPSS